MNERLEKHLDLVNYSLNQKEQFYASNNPLRYISSFEKTKIFKC